MTKQVTPTTIFVGGPLPSVFEHEVAEEPVMKPDKLKQLISPQKEDHKPSLEKRSVHMSPNVHYREIPHLNDLSDEEVNAVWLTPENFLETKKGYTQIVQMMMRSREPIEESDDICTRGLEFRTKEGSRRRKRIKKQGVEAVLLEQEIQQEEGLTDEQWISDVYREVSGPSSLNALNTGLRDEKRMLALLAPEDREKRESLKSMKKLLESPKSCRTSIDSLDDEALLLRLAQKSPFE